MKGQRVDPPMKKGATDLEFWGGCLAIVIGIMLLLAVVAAFVVVIAYAFRIGAGL